MTAVDEVLASAPVEGDNARTDRPTVSAWRSSWVTPVAATATGVIIVGCSYRLSALGYPAALYYAVFWAGMLISLVPVACRAVNPKSDRSDRVWAILLFAVLTIVPKLLRNPTGPSYHDEYAHWREAVDVVGSGRLFAPNTTIPIVEYFPGTSALTTAAYTFSGLDIWSSGLLVTATMHILGIFAVYLLGEALLSSPRAGSVAALVYGINPSSIYFDTQYAYESIAINLFLWTLTLTALSARARPGRTRWALTATAAMSAAGCVVTHHLSTVFLLGALITVVIVSTVAVRFGIAERSSIAPWWITLGVGGTVAVAWVGFVARPTLLYLSPYFGSSVHQLRTMADKKGDGGRTLLVPSVQPEWERLMTAAAPVAVMLTVALAVILIRRDRIRLAGPTLGLMVFGLAYFVSLPFILAPSGAEGARRSWGFTYVGIALMTAFVVMYWPAGQPRRRPHRWHQPLALLVFVILLIGNVGGGLNDPYRFPGPFRWGTDTNSASAEARSVSEQLGSQVGRVWVVSDAYTALQLAAYGGMAVAAPSDGFPAWELTQTDTDPRPALAQMLVTSRYDYLVVDIRMAEETAFNGHNFGRGDPLLGRPTPMANLVRLDAVPWATRVITGEHLRVYRLNLASIAFPGGQR